MKDIISKESAILISGDGKLAASIAITLLLAKQPVVVLTRYPEQVRNQLMTHAEDVAHWWHEPVDLHAALVTAEVPVPSPFAMAIVVTDEDLDLKKAAIETVEALLLPGGIIAVNTESIPLSKIQQDAQHPARIIGVNWVEPVHTTYFMEIIANDACEAALVDGLMEQARCSWRKDPYLVRGEQGIRSRLVCAMVREAFHLVENGYVTYEDIDRACRNDAGYYLPFAGNFRYMDLMGTFVYGIVMKDMNPDLTKNRQVPDFFSAMVGGGHTGMDAQEGFYTYGRKEHEKWQQIARDFSYQVHEIIEKYQNVI